jgi:hypothetical protein
MWFIAVMNGVNEKSMRIPLNFLKPNKTYETIIVKDQPNDPAAVLVEPELHKTSDVIGLKLAGGGGYVAMFTLEAPDKKK